MKGEISDDGSLENVRVERENDNFGYGAKFKYFGTLARGRWEYEAKKAGDNWGCGGTYVEQSGR